MTPVRWTPRTNTQREALRRTPDWFEIRRDGTRVLISTTGDWRTGDLRWINADQIK